MPGADTRSDPAADLALIADAAREGGEIALRYFRQDPQVWFKEGDSPVSEADFAVDRHLFARLHAARPDYGWLSEETADSPERLSARRTFVVDPIDGTRGFVAGRRTWCVSVAVVEEGRSLVGVLDCPALGEVFTATAGKSAQLNGRSIAARAAPASLAVTGPRVFLDHLPEPWRGRVERHEHVPSLAYRLAMIAKGALDATFVKPGAHDWDLAAAALILSESGGRLATADNSVPSYGTTLNPTHGPLSAATLSVSDACVAALAGWVEAERNG